MADLVKLAKKDARMILHHVTEDGAHLYFIQDAGLTYVYEVPGDAPKATATLSEA